MTSGILVVDKPNGWTSHDVVAKLRGLYHEKRIGHGGTLDPMATGVLPVFIGRATRAVPFCENAEKEYLAAFRPGIVTDTQDITGTVLEVNDVSFSDEEFKTVLADFTGSISQIPPMYSAVKVNGRKLYELARKGIETERKPRSVTIHQLDWEGRDGTDYLLRVRCSKGTYIRTLCHDIGHKLGCGACLSSLRRTQAGRFTMEDCVSIEDIVKAAETGSQMNMLRPVDSLFNCPHIVISGKQLKLCLNGNPFEVPDCQDGDYRVYNEQGDFLVLGTVCSGTMHTVKSFF